MTMKLSISGAITRTFWIVGAVLLRPGRASWGWETGIAAALIVLEPSSPGGVRYSMLRRRGRAYFPVRRLLRFVFNLLDTCSGRRKRPRLTSGWPRCVSFNRVSATSTWAKGIRRILCFVSTRSKDNVIGTAEIVLLGSCAYTTCSLDQAKTRGTDELIIVQYTFDFRPMLLVYCGSTISISYGGHKTIIGGFVCSGSVRVSLHREWSLWSFAVLNYELFCVAVRVCPGTVKYA